MKNLLYKELRLFLTPLNFLFLAFTLMVFIPGGYPILLSSFFIMMSVFISFQLAREHHDVLYTVLLPVKKSDAVKARYASVIALQAASFILFIVFVSIRMAVLSNVPEYGKGVLMPGNLTFLGFVLISYALFNCVFVGGFFKTAYNYAKPFVLYIIFFFLLVFIDEASGFIPGLEFLRATSGADVIKQIPFLVFGALVYILGTMLSQKKASRAFEKLDI